MQNIGLRSRTVNRKEQPRWTCPPPHCARHATITLYDLELKNSLATRHMEYEK